jgi:hypothetical protein
MRRRGTLSQTYSAGDDGEFRLTHAQLNQSSIVEGEVGAAAEAGDDTLQRLKVLPCAPLITVSDMFKHVPPELKSLADEACAGQWVAGRPEGIKQYHVHGAGVCRLAYYRRAQGRVSLYSQSSLPLSEFV